jgi:hypothetical protein
LGGGRGGAGEGLFYFKPGLLYFLSFSSRAGCWVSFVGGSQLLSADCIGCIGVAVAGCFGSLVSVVGCLILIVVVGFPWSVRPY